MRYKISIPPITTDNKDDQTITGVIENTFDSSEVQAELDLQTDVTKEFDENRQIAKQYINQKAEEHQKNGDEAAAQDWDNVGIILDMIAGGLYNPSESLGGSLVNGLNPLVVEAFTKLNKNPNT